MVFKHLQTLKHNKCLIMDISLIVIFSGSILIRVAQIWTIMATRNLHRLQPIWERFHHDWWTIHSIVQTIILKMGQEYSHSIIIKTYHHLHGIRNEARVQIINQVENLTQNSHHINTDLMRIKLDSLTCHQINLSVLSQLYNACPIVFNGPHSQRRFICLCSKNAFWVDLF